MNNNFFLNHLMKYNIDAAKYNYSIDIDKIMNDYDTDLTDLFPFVQMARVRMNH